MKDVEVVWQDERLTTVMAEKVLIEADVDRKKRKKKLSTNRRQGADHAELSGQPCGKNKNTNNI